MQKKTTIKRIKKTRGEVTLDSFLSLPRESQILFFDFLEAKSVCIGENPYTVFSMMDDFGCNECESPIEKMFYFAYQLYLDGFVGDDRVLYGIIPQYEISVDGKNYRADFVFDTQECIIEDADYKNDFKLVIECDGHDFHEKTKEQVQKRNERDFDLKRAGYDVIHYSGSQIFKNSMKCAKEVFEYIRMSVGNNG